MALNLNPRTHNLEEIDSKSNIINYKLDHGIHLYFDANFAFCIARTTYKLQFFLYLSVQDACLTFVVIFNFHQNSLRRLMKGPRGL